MDKTARKRLVYFLLLSVVLHLILLYALGRTPFPAPEPPEEHPLVVELIEPEEPKPALPKKKLERFDMMEVKEALSEVPASLSKSREGSKEKVKQARPEKPVPKKTEKKPEKKVAKKPPPKPVPKPSAVLTPPLPDRDGLQKPKKRAAKKKREPRKKDQKISREKSRDVKEKKPEEPAPRELPSVHELIPSINDIFAMKAPGGSLYEDPKIVQDGIGERQAKVMYDEYLAEFKSRVKLKRCVSCGEPVVSELVEQVLCRRGGPKLTEILAGEDFCPQCKRQKLATELTAAVRSRAGL